MSSEATTPEAPKTYRAGRINERRYFDTFEEAAAYAPCGIIARRTGKVYRQYSIRELAELGLVVS